MPQASPKPQRSSRASRAVVELGNFVKAFVQFVYYKLTHPSEERWRTVALCLALSATFWLLRAMARTTQYLMPVHVKAHYDHRKFFLLNPFPAQMKVSVTARGWNLAGMWVSLYTAPAAFKPELHTGQYRLGPALVQEALENRFPNVKVNYVVVPLDTFQVDTMVHHSIPVHISGLKSSQVKTLSICYFGPSSQVVNFPRSVDLTQVRPSSSDKRLVKTAFPKAWQQYICSSQANQRLSHFLNEKP